jgi:hypothetical protein
MKRSSFWLKAVGAGAAVIVLGGVAAVLTLKAFFPEPKLRAMTVDAARKQLGREVRLESVGVGLRGISLRGLEISEKPDFTAGTFVRVESFLLRPSWKALLRRKLVVATVTANGLKVTVVKGADGKFNYETLMTSGTAPTAAPVPKTADAEAPELDVRRARVTGGTIEYVDKTSAAHWSLSDLDLDVKDFGLTAPFGLIAAVHVKGNAGTRPVDAKIAFDGSIDLARGDRKDFTAVVKRLVVESEGARVSAFGKVAGMDSPKISFDADLSAAGKDLLHASGTAGVGAAVDFDLKAKTPGFDTTLLAKFAPQSGVPAMSVPAAELSAAGSYSADRADIRDFKATWNGGHAEGSGSARGLQGAKPSYDGKATFGADLPEVRPGEYAFLHLPPKATVPAMRVDGDVSLTGDDFHIAALKAAFKGGTVNASGTVHRVGSAKPSPDIAAALAIDLPAFKASDLPVAVSALPPSLLVPASRLDGTVKVSGEDVRFEKLTVKAKGARVTLDGVVAKALAGAPAPDLSVTADLDLPPLTDKDLPFPQVPAGLQAPASKWTVDAAYSTRLVKIKSLRLLVGHNDLDVSGTVTDPAGRGAFDLLLKCRSFALDELTKLTPKTRDEKLTGTGFFAVSVTGVKEHPVYAGKLQFKGIGATIAEMPFSDMTGTVSFDQKRIDLPNLTGKVGDGTLKMDLTVKDYTRSPEIQLDADLDRFDLGRWLTAKAKVQADRAEAKAAKAAKPGAAPEEKPAVLSTRGHFNVGKLIHPNATVDDVRASWDLRGVAADLNGLDGDASLRVGGGKLHSLGDMATQSKLLKVMIFPLLIVQNLGKIGGLRLFPDFNDITINQFVGDYGFKDGLMTVRKSEMDSDAAQLTATGTIDLPKQLLDLTMTAQVAKIAPFDIFVTGPVDHPTVKKDLSKIFTGAAKGLLDSLIKKPDSQ